MASSPPQEGRQKQPQLHFSYTLSGSQRFITSEPQRDCGRAYFPSKSATMDFSSFNSASVAAILALLKSLSDTFGTISNF